jgi:hypothetical protein
MAQRGARPSIPFRRHPVFDRDGLSAAHDERKQAARGQGLHVELKRRPNDVQG